MKLEYAIEAVPATGLQSWNDQLVGQLYTYLTTNAILRCMPSDVLAKRMIWSFSPRLSAKDLVSLGEAEMEKAASAADAENKCLATKRAEVALQTWI